MLVRDEEIFFNTWNLLFGKYGEVWSHQPILSDHTKQFLLCMVVLKNLCDIYNFIDT
jgi:hypothetical protein